MDPDLDLDPSLDPGLDPDAAALLRRIAAAGAPPPHAGTPEQARQAHCRSAPALAGPGEPVAEVDDTTVSGVPVRLYRPAGARGVTLYLHGGGWVLGTLDTYDTLCRALANRSGTTVISVAYTLAPGARHPTQLRQARSCLAWAVREQAGGEPVAVAGDSSGAHLATLLAQSEPESVRAQALIYPVIDPLLNRESALTYAKGYYLETETLRWFWDQYLPADPSAAGEPVSPLDGPLERTPPTLLLTAGFDPLRSEAEEYAARLESLGVPVERAHFPGQIHGFARFTGVIGQAADALRTVGDFLRRTAG
ncbi:alpha/beta hydrolase [Nonomuraea rubra]|uniref:Acetyl esterase n=1 Tax=Nonomuraea rubra TaxID=46180 RepID=A0A7X0NPI8_9ACTN|nr:alpha/beta hydrolase [Nonomuraea rubra]MBB6547278.1 acetyl esterase [Nonomuraea rubra]